MAKKKALKIISAFNKKSKEEQTAQTGIPGLDELFSKPFPKESSILIAGGPGSGKTILCLQSIASAAKKGEKCLYISFEEKEKRLKEHMKDFNWDFMPLEKKGLLKIIRKDPFTLSSNIEAMVAKAKGELIIDINQILDIVPKGFKPDRIVIDSLSAISSAFAGREEGYRLFIEQLFRYCESLKATTFYISETEELPSQSLRSGDENFLADGIIFMYNLRRSGARISALEIIKMRGVKIVKRIVPFEILENGIVVYPKEIVPDNF